MLQGIDRLHALLSRAFKSMSKGSYWKRTTTWQILYSLGRFKRGEGYFCKWNQQKRLLWRRSYWREICKKTEKKMLGTRMLKKLFHKWNKWYYKTVVLNIGLRTRPVGPPATGRVPGRSARSRPLAAARLGPPAADTHCSDTLFRIPPRIAINRGDTIQLLWTYAI